METSGFVTKEELIKIIEGIISSRVVKGIEEFVRKNTERAQEFSVLERVVRVEEETKSLREFESGRFEALESRFQSLMREVGKGFEWMAVLDLRRQDSPPCTGRWISALRPLTDTLILLRRDLVSCSALC